MFINRPSPWETFTVDGSKIVAVPGIKYKAIQLDYVGAATGNAKVSMSLAGIDGPWAQIGITYTADAIIFHTGIIAALKVEMDTVVGTINAYFAHDGGV